MTVVGIDVSKGKSMVAAMKPGGELVTTPYEVKHSDIELSRFALDVLCMEPDTRVVMEATGRYHEPVAALLHSGGIFVSVLNPLLIKQSGAGSLRKVKSDPKDALKIAKYGLDNWSTLREYTPMEAIRQQLKLCARQCDLYSKNIVMLTNNLISLSDKTFPGVNELFSSPEKENGHLKWVDFYDSGSRFIFLKTACLETPICCSLFVFKLYHKTCEHFYRSFGLYEKDHVKYIV